MYQPVNIIITEDGSHTVAVPSKNITYHSIHGAIQESLHVFIQAGLEHFINHNPDHQFGSVHIFEMGFGTGLNALLSLQHAIQHKQNLFYQTIELYPLSTENVLSLNYTDRMEQCLKESFYAMHQCKWNETILLHPYFSFQKTKTDLAKFETATRFHLIYFDAFDPHTQPELWTESIFKKMLDMLYTNGILVTYCSKGAVQRALKAAGFTIEKLKGPPGKREVVRAVKNK